MAGETRSIRERRDRERERLFVGRRAEHEAIMSLLTGPEPDFNIVEISGVGGIGKSALLDRCLNDMRPDAHVARSSIEVDTTPLAILASWATGLGRNLLREYDKKERRYLAAMERVASEESGLKPALMSAVESSGMAGGMVTGAIGKDRLKSILGKYLPGQDVDLYLDAPEHLTSAYIDGVNELAARRRVIMAIDYFEGASGDVDRWLRGLLDRGLSSNTVLVIATRDRLERIDTRWLDWRQSTLPVPLGPLSDDETAEYLRRRQIADPSIIEDFTANSHGIPAAVEWSADFWLAEHNTALGRLTGSFAEVHKAVADRMLNQLDANDKHTLQVLFSAAVLRWFTEDLLEHVAGGQPSDQLGYLLRYSFLTVRLDGAYALDDSFRFYVEERFKTRNRDLWHAAHVKAAAYHRSALSKAPDQTRDWLAHLVEATYHEFTLDAGSASVYLASLIASLPWPTLLQQIGPVVDAAKLATGSAPAVVGLAEGLLSLAASDLPTAEDGLRLAVEDVDGTTGPRLRATAAVYLVDALNRQGEVEAALESAQAWRHKATSAGEIDLGALLAARAAEAAGILGNLTLSAELSGEAEVALQEAGHGLIPGEAWLVLAWTYAFRGAYEDAERATERSHDCWRSIDHQYGLAQLDSTDAWLNFLLGRFDRAVDLAQRAEEYFVSVNDRFYIAMAKMNRAEAERRRGQLSRALDLGGEAAALFSDLGVPIYEAIARYRLGWAQYQAGNVDGALEDLLIAFDIEANRVDERYSLGMVAFYLFEVELSRGAITSARDYARVAIDAWESAQNGHGRSYAEFVRACLDTIDGNVTSARSALQRAIEKATTPRYGEILADAALLDAILLHEESESEAGILEVALAPAYEVSDIYNAHYVHECRARIAVILTASTLRVRSSGLVLLRGPTP